MKKWIIVFLVIAVAAFAILFGTADSHQTNARYIAWKMGWSDYDPKVALRYLNVDVKFRKGLHGRGLSQVSEYFPDLRTLDKSNDYQSYYRGSITYEEFYWIDDSAWGIEFQNGRLREFHLFKG